MSRVKCVKQRKKSFLVHRLNGASDILASGEFVADLRVTLTELFVAFAISAVSGVTLGYVISRTRYRIRVFDPLFSAIYAVPAFTHDWFRSIFQ